MQKSNVGTASLSRYEFSSLRPDIHIGPEHLQHLSASCESAGPAAQPLPPLRFPWLSRLSQELASAARQTPAFPAAPVLGDNLDRSV